MLRLLYATARVRVHNRAYGAQYEHVLGTELSDQDMQFLAARSHFADLKDSIQAMMNRCLCVVCNSVLQ